MGLRIAYKEVERSQRGGVWRARAGHPFALSAVGKESWLGQISRRLAWANLQSGRTVMRRQGHDSLCLQALCSVLKP